MSADSKSNVTILVVDDLPATISFVRTALEETGYTVLVATNGREALKRAALTRPALILLDVLMPGMDGYETCKQLKSQETTKDIPVIFMTVVTETVDKVKGFQLGAVDYLTKPIETEELLARVQTHLTIARLRQELQAANAGLEQQVAARTAELRATNAQLEIELAERKRVEEALRNSEERLRLTMEASNIGSWDWDVKNDVWHGSPIYYTMLGYEPKAGPADRNEWLERVHPDEQAFVAEKIQDVLTRDFEEHRYEARLRHADGTYRWQYVYGFGIERNAQGNVTRMLGIRMDITERKQAEDKLRRFNEELEQRVSDRTAQLEAANKELEAFAYSISHDMRAPLRHIDGFLELLKQRTVGAFDERSLHYMDTISDAARRMGQLIDDLLTFSRMGRTELAKTPVDLSALVQETIQELEPETGDRIVHWHVADLPTVSGDQAMLRQVLVNLIANALKFTRPCPAAKIEIGCLPNQDNEIIVFVRDNGVGFDMAYADKLFGVFQRLHRADEFEGTGIGLANVRRIVNRHSGRVWAEGQVNQGATFYVSLPQ